MSYINRAYRARPNRRLVLINLGEFKRTASSLGYTFYRFIYLHTFIAIAVRHSWTRPRQSYTARVYHNRFIYIYSTGVILGRSWTANRQ